MFPDGQQNSAAFSLPSQKVIVVIEDDFANAELLEGIIKYEMNCSVVTLRNARLALQKMDEIIALSPSLFLIDYTLPTMTAFMFYQRLRIIPELASLPVIILMDQAYTHIIEAIQKAGLPFLSKPFEVGDLLDLIQQSLQL